jgi:hypothetical protein
MDTAKDVITEAMRLYGIVDQTEDPGDEDIANNVKVLNNLLRSEHVGGAAQYLMGRAYATIPAGAAGSVSSFTIGTADQAYLVQQDAVALRSLWVCDTGTINRETRAAPTADVVRSTALGIITKWHQERQIDGSVLVTVWQPPRTATKVLLEYGRRVPALTKPDGSDVVGMPPEGTHDAALLLGRRIFSAYGRKAADVATVLADSERVHARWSDWAKGQMWLRMVRS